MRRAGLAVALALLAVVVALLPGCGSSASSPGCGNVDYYDLQGSATHGTYAMGDMGRCDGGGAPPDAGGGQ